MHVGSYASMFFLTITNPMTILSFAGIFLGLGVGGGSVSHVSAALLVLGVFTGSALWWFVLSGVANVFRTEFSGEKLKWINRVSGIIIMAFGVIALLSLTG